MNTYIALFRGINVGGKNILPMKELVTILEETGYHNIQTYIQSGNVVMQGAKEVSKSSAAEIGKNILKEKGFEPKVFFLSMQEFMHAVKNNPFTAISGKDLHFFFLESEPPNPNLMQLSSLKTGSEEFNLYDRVFYLYAPDGIGRSKLAAVVEKVLGVPGTGRNWNTVNKLVSMAEKLL